MFFLVESGGGGFNKRKTHNSVKIDGIKTVVMNGMEYIVDVPDLFMNIELEILLIYQSMPLVLVIIDPLKGLENLY